MSKKVCSAMDPNFRTLSKSASKQRIRELRADGWTVKTVRVAGIGTVVTKRKRDSLAPSTGPLVALGAVLAVWFFATRRGSSSPV